ncbi:MAG: FKBP-type peptidyl-prolyl cis-trans isomerase [Bacteroidales bacterium]|nr:MAG: FKBP-type peptidyl-prolyl cis-trans isomerase [Bacteroidales bacterium]
MKFLKPTLALISMVVIMSGCNSKIGKVDIKTDSDSLSYAIGINMGYNLKNSKIDNVNIIAVANGMQDVKEAKKDLMTPEKSMEIIQKFLTKQKEAEGLKNIEVGKKFLEDNAKNEGVISDPEGFQYKTLQEGTGAMPAETDVVKVHYKGTLIDGTEFDSSFKTNQPAQFPLNGVIRGWTLGLQKMKVGGKMMLWLPASLAYGERGGGPIGPNQTLIFEIELLEIVKEVNK